MGQLTKSGRHLASRCPLCGKEEENIDHLLLHYSEVQDLWAFLFTIFGACVQLEGLRTDGKAFLLEKNSRNCGWQPLFVCFFFFF